MENTTETKPTAGESGYRPSERVKPPNPKEGSFLKKKNLLWCHHV